MVTMWGKMWGQTMWRQPHVRVCRRCGGRQLPSHRLTGGCREQRVHDVGGNCIMWEGPVSCLTSHRSYDVKHHASKLNIDPYDEQDDA